VEFASLWLTLRSYDRKDQAAADYPICASVLTMPFGVAFWPPGTSPQLVYAANTDSAARCSIETAIVTARAPADGTGLGAPATPSATTFRFLLPRTGT